MNIEKKGHVSLNLWTHFNDIVNALDDKNKQESLLWWNVFRYIKVYVFWKLIHWDHLSVEIKYKQTQQKLLNKRNFTKNALFFLSRAPACHNFTFILWLLYELKHKVASFKSVCRILQFRFCFVFIKVYFFKQKAWTLWLIIPFKIKIVEKLYTRLKSCTRVCSKYSDF